MFMIYLLVCVAFFFGFCFASLFHVGPHGAYVYKSNPYLDESNSAQREKCAECKPNSKGLYECETCRKQGDDK